MFRRFARGERGFTMIEMMVVLIIIAVLIGVGIKFYTGYIDKARITKAKGDITTMQAALDSYYAENNRYPDVNELAGAGLPTDIVDATGSKTYKYTRSDPNQYSIETSNPVDGTHKVRGTGANGRSSPPELTTP